VEEPAFRVDCEDPHIKIGYKFGYKTGCKVGPATRLSPQTSPQRRCRIRKHTETSSLLSLETLCEKVLLHVAMMTADGSEDSDTAQGLALARHTAEPRRSLVRRPESTWQQCWQIALPWPWTTGDEARVHEQDPVKRRALTGLPYATAAQWHILRFFAPSQ
jgi:hypothetical protein